nr:hypothetical protein [Pseudomonas syringae group genomosp. 3]
MHFGIRLTSKVSTCILGQVYPLAVIVVQVEVARQFFAGKPIWIATVAFPLGRGILGALLVKMDYGR